MHRSLGVHLSFIRWGLLAAAVLLPGRGCGLSKGEWLSRLDHLAREGSGGRPWEGAACVGPLPHSRFVSAYRLTLPSFLLVKLDTVSISFRGKVRCIDLVADLLVEYVWSETMIVLKGKDRSKLECLRIRPLFGSQQ